MNTVSARQIQREYKKVLETANKVNEPIIVMSNNKPQGAIIGLELLEKIQLDTVLREAMAEYKAGKTVAIRTEDDLERHFSEIDELISEK